MPRPATPLLALAVLVAVSVPALAQGRVCRVNDPTGTPLNVRSSPGGEILGTIGNGREVELVETRTDGRGREWSLVRQPGAGAAMGWVFRVFVACPR